MEHKQFYVPARESLSGPSLDMTQLKWCDMDHRQFHIPARVPVRS